MTNPQQQAMLAADTLTRFVAELERLHDSFAEMHELLQGDSPEVKAAWDKHRMHMLRDIGTLMEAVDVANVEATKFGRDLRDFAKGE